MNNITRSKLIRAASVDMGGIYEHGRQQLTTTNNTLYRRLQLTKTGNYHAVNIQ